ncbi:MAG: lysoplasmalogenase [Deltaproteobacteria bacterium]|nr:lysoplasmalogenase [Deltaproteobacteria bacterium]
MPSLFSAGVLLTVLATAALVAAEGRGSFVGRAVTKPLASTGFLLAAVGAGALDSSAGRAVLAALALSFLGDVLLIPSATFLLGLGAFLLGHLAFAVAFVLRGVDPATSLVATAALAVPSFLVSRWLLPHVPSPMKAPVVVYVAVITLMTGLAFGASALEARPIAVIAAVAFAVSDVSVARDRFVAPGFGNRVWGLPLYYAAQLAFALDLRG